MIIHAYRIVKAKHAASAFTGQGARRAGGRWNSPGVAMVYVANSISLAMLEMLVHLRGKELLKRYVSFEVAFDDALVMSAAIRDLPKDWQTWPPPVGLQRIGDEWVSDAGSAVLAVPSVIVPAESNYVLNPAHPEYTKITFGPWDSLGFDRRLIRKP